MSIHFMVFAALKRNQYQFGQPPTQCDAGRMRYLWIKKEQASCSTKSCVDGVY